MQVQHSSFYKRVVLIFVYMLDKRRGCKVWFRRVESARGVGCRGWGLGGG